MDTTEQQRNELAALLVEQSARLDAALAVLSRLAALVERNPRKYLGDAELLSLADEATLCVKEFWS